ncbi:MAG: M20/M25/M40 family metallo-hydrolase [Acidobacteria bacterium]|nr:M20/M25/M40 family metallo-hydrolase [Acidobacteriota bacterium]
MRLYLCASLLLLLIPFTSSTAEDVDLSVVHRIKAEAFRNSQVMDHMFHLSDVIGPRLSGSPEYRQAAEWAVSAMKEWGIKRVELERWGKFGRGWSLKRFSAHLVEPRYVPLNGAPMAWTAGTQGVVTAEVVAAPLYESKAQAKVAYDLVKLTKHLKEYAEKNKGALKGKIVLLDRIPEFEPREEPLSKRFNDEGLARLARAPEPVAAEPIEWPITSFPIDEKERYRAYATLPLEVTEDYSARSMRVWGLLHAFLRDEGVVAAFHTSDEKTGGIIFVDDSASWEEGAPVPPPMIVLPPETYAQIARLIEKEIPVKVELHLEVEFYDDDLDDWNVIAEIPGGEKKNELIMLGGHLDSWQAGTGASDNAAGCAVVMEALRILKALDLKLDRTVRLALWGGEEQGLFGSRGYVRTHFGDPITMEVKRGHARLSGYFNIDNGSGKIRGVYLQGNDMMRPIFADWLAPFRDLGVETISIRNTRGTDHLSFDAVGLPGFQFIQDPLEYSTQTHHSNIDVYDHVVPTDLMQASAVLASVVYHAATREEMLPRKPLPDPLPEKKPTDIGVW